MGMRLTRASDSFVHDVGRRLEGEERADFRWRLERAVEEVREGRVVLHQSLTANAFLMLRDGEFPRGTRTSASQTGEVFIGIGSTAISVLVSDMANGSDRPVTIEWPLVRFNFPTLLDVRCQFMAFGMFSGVQDRVRNLVERCLDELEVPHIRPY